MSYRTLAIVVATLGALLAVKAWNAHLIAEGDAQGALRVQTRWDTAEVKRRADIKEAEARAATEQAEAERKTRIDEQAKQKQAERVANEQAKREASLRASLDRADARNRGLLDTIAQLNNNARARAAADVPGASADASTSAIVDEATTARELLGQCSQRYTGVAAAVDGLRVQVIGLQAFVADVCLAQGSN